MLRVGRAPIQTQFEFVSRPSVARLGPLRSPCDVQTQFEFVSRPSVASHVARLGRCGAPVMYKLKLSLYWGPGGRHRGARGKARRAAPYWRTASCTMTSGLIFSVPIIALKGVMPKSGWLIAMRAICQPPLACVSALTVFVTPCSVRSPAML
jgi:hypothetical protein